VNSGWFYAAYLIRFPQRCSTLLPTKNLLSRDVTCSLLHTRTSFSRVVRAGGLYLPSSRREGLREIRLRCRWSRITARRSSWSLRWHPGCLWRAPYSLCRFRQVEGVLSQDVSSRVLYPSVLTYLSFWDGWLPPLPCWVCHTLHIRLRFSGCPKNVIIPLVPVPPSSPYHLPGSLKFSCCTSVVPASHPNPPPSIPSPSPRLPGALSHSSTDSNVTLMAAPSGKLSPTPTYPLVPTPPRAVVSPPSPSAVHAKLDLAQSQVMTFKVHMWICWYVLDHHCVPS